MFFLLKLFYPMHTILNNFNNQCPTFMDYLFLSVSPNCYFNPDVGQPLSRIVTHYGYPYSEIKLTTNDGYNLTMGRLPNSGPPIFLQHGIDTLAEGWLNLGNNSLPFRLYNMGYDIWIGNFRGNHYYPNVEANISIPSDKYWNFSWHELGVSDLPIMLNHITEETKSKKKILYIGHSMGSTVSYVYSIVHKEEAEKKLLSIISLAPVAYMKNINWFLTFLASMVDFLADIAFSFGIYGVGFPEIGQRIRYLDFCIEQITRVPCYIITDFILWLVGDPILTEHLPKFLASHMSGESLKTFIHYAQNINADGNFQYYDYGKEMNRELYDSENPPAYDVRQITVPVHLYYGKEDPIATEQNVIYLYKRLRTKKSITRIPEKGPIVFRHEDFLNSPFIEELYGPLLKHIQEIESEND